MKESLHIAPAKINLALEVLYKRADGYHELNTIFHKVSEPHDIIAVGPSTGYLLTTNDRSLDTGSTNLITRAVGAVAEALGEKLPRCNIHLAKGIPTGAGLGGGSSDAAVALRVVNEIFESRLTEDQLFDIARNLGADVPFFLSPYSTAIAAGIGEILTPIELQIDHSILVAKPTGLSISTQEAYARLLGRTNPTPTPYASLLGPALRSEDATNYFRNDFETALSDVHPELVILKSRLYGLGAEFAQMTGSGSAFYALFSDVDGAKTAQETLRREGLQVFINKPRHSR